MLESSFCHHDCQCQIANAASHPGTLLLAEPESLWLNQRSDRDFFASHIAALSLQVDTGHRADCLGVAFQTDSAAACQCFKFGQAVAGCGTLTPAPERSSTVAGDDGRRSRARACGAGHGRSR